MSMFLTCLVLLMIASCVQEATTTECPLTRVFECDENARYRTADGLCNNLKNPTLGMSNMPQARFLEPVYGDGEDSPRQFPWLPSPRKISNKLFDAGDKRDFGRNTVQLMAWGQLLAHDLVSTPMVNAKLECCNDTACIDNPACFPIPVPTDDPYFHKPFLNFVRSAAADKICFPGKRKQLNEVTSFVDASMVYGSTPEHMAALRDSEGGKLKMTGGYMLPENPNGECKRFNPGDICQLAGDGRVDEVPNLSANHLLFVRVHNNIASQLGNINPQWNDETIFQETRRIVGALVQKITFKDYLSTLLGMRIATSSGLRSPAKCPYNNLYDPDIDPTVRNGFAVGVMRVGHTMIPSEQNYLSKDYTSLEKHILSDQFFNTHMMFDSGGSKVTDYVRWMTYKESMTVDRFFQPEIRNKLFDEGNGKSQDLPARNIQRSRDHGVPSYNMWRQFCGLTLADFSDPVISDHDKESSDILKELYSEADHIDLFAGAISELPEGGSLLGPTYNCMFTRQFRNLKYGDRLYYEWNRGSAGFTKAQINAINKVTLAKLFCENFNLPKILHHVFWKPYQWNKLTPCSQLPGLDLNLWKE